jgi:hypothetical protein
MAKPTETKITPGRSALASFHYAAPVIGKTDEVTVSGKKGTYKYSYTPLDKIFATYKPVLQAQELYLDQNAGSEIHDGKLYASVQTFIRKSADDEIVRSSPVMLFGPITDIHDMGGAFTYMKRYQANTMMTVSPADEDDDGKGVVESAVVVTGKLKQIKDQIERTGTDPEAVKKYYGVKFFDELTAEQQDDCIDTLNHKATS